MAIDLLVGESYLVGDVGESVGACGGCFVGSEFGGILARTQGDG